MRPRARVVKLALAALAAFGGVVAVQLGRARTGPVESGGGGGGTRTPGLPPPEALAPGGAAPVPAGSGAATAGPDAGRAAPVGVRVRLGLGALDAAVLPRASFVLRLLGADGVEVALSAPVARAVEATSSAPEVSAWTTTEGARTDVFVAGLPPGACRALAVVTGAGVVLGIGGPIPMETGAAEGVLDVVPAERLGAVVVDVRRGGAAFGPARVTVRAGGLTVGGLAGARGRAAPIPAPTGIPLEVGLLEAPGHEELGLPPSQGVTLSPRETREVPFDLDDGVPFAIRALGPDGAALPFRALVWAEREGRGPRRAPGLLLTAGAALEHTGRGPVGELAVLVIPTRTGGPTWARAALAGRTTVPIDVRVGLDGGVLDVRLRDADGAPRAGLEVEVVRADAPELADFSAWSGSADAEGRVVTPPLPAGTYLLEVGGRFVRPVAVPASGVALTLEVPAIPVARDPRPVLDVRMTAPDGRPHAAASAYVRPEDGGWGQRLEPRRDEPGRFEAPVLPAGRFRVVAPWTWDAGPPHGAVDVPVTLLGEGAVRIDVPLPAR